MKATLMPGVALLLAVTVHADETFRCGKWIVKSDMSLAEFTGKCGQPNSKTSRTEDVRAPNAYTGGMVKIGETTIETWTYDRGTQAAPMVVTIVDGTIKSIDRKR